MLVGAAVGGGAATVVLGFGMFKAVQAVGEQVSKIDFSKPLLPGGGRSEEVLGPDVGPTDATKCTLVGENGTKKLTAEVGVPGKFTIEARNKFGNRRTKGGDVFVVSIRGFSAVEDDTTDAGDGTYPVYFNCPGPSGVYKISIMLDGVQLKGSPFKLKVAPASNPYAGMEEAKPKKPKKKKKKLKAAALAAGAASSSSPGGKPPSPGSKAPSPGKAKSPDKKKPDDSDSDTSGEDDSPGTSDSSSDDDDQGKGKAKK